MARASPRSAPVDPVTASLVRAELARILGSEVFARSVRLSAFLTFIVDRTLAGEGDSLKEQVIAIEAYGKSTDFNPAADPIVRVDARRLRDRLREFYATSSDSVVVIAVTKGSYTPVFHQAGVAVGTGGGAIVVSPAAAEPSAAARPVSRLWTFVAAILLVTAAYCGVARFRREVPSEPPLLLTATSMPGAEEDPSLSPQGDFIAFSWGGEAPDAKHHIWIKPVQGGDGATQLTHAPDVSDRYPRISPDGQNVAFTRYSRGDADIYRISVLGGSEVMMAEHGSDAVWAPDGRSLVMRARTAQGGAGLVHYIVATGERRLLTAAPATFQDIHPRVSPDAKLVAFQRSAATQTAVFLVPLSGGEPEMAVAWRSGIIGGLEWTPDGRELLVALPETSGRQLMRVTAEYGKIGTPVPVSAVPHGALSPSVSRARSSGTYRLAVVSGIQDVGLRLMDLQAPRQAGNIAGGVPFYDATRMDTPGRFSPDGRQVAFVSDRSGDQQIWIAKVDGSALRSVTQLTDAVISLGSWAPDGRMLAFDATIGDRTHLYTVPTAGGPATRVTDGTSTEIQPEWSRDGRWIYFTSNESGSFAIWKMPSGGGARRRLTSEPGFQPRESPDGRTIYFVDRDTQFGLGLAAGLKRVSAEGGAANAVDVPVLAGAWDVTDAGILFIVVEAAAGAGDVAGASDVLRLYDFAEGRIRTIAPLGFRVGPYGSHRFLTASRDGRWALASHVDRWDRDVLVVDNFR